MTDALPLGLVCLRAPNPSPLTGGGTNTYVLGHDRLTVIDPGPDIPSHLAAILDMARNRPIDQIIVTHSHHDHSGLAPGLASKTGAPVLAFGTADSGMSPAIQTLAPHLPPAGEGLDAAFCPDRTLIDAEELQSDVGPLRVIHTPGHLGNHICLAWRGVLFSGDHVMGWATSIVAPPQGDMGAYRASLRRLQEGEWQTFMPGHGNPVTTPAARLAELLAHRQAREDQIVLALSQGRLTPEDLRARIYTDLAPTLWPAAEQNVLAHLIELWQRGIVTSDGPPGPGTTFQMG